MKNKGFTLVELLVVISIIAMLLTISLTAVASAREKARNIICNSNLRNISIALRLYLDDNNGKMPSAEPYPGKYGTENQHWFNNSILMSNLNLKVIQDSQGRLVSSGLQKSVLTCPTHRNPELSRDDPSINIGFGLSYMANGTLGVSGRSNMPTSYRSQWEYKKPSAAMMFTDGIGNQCVPGIVLYEGCPKDNFAFRHNNKANVLFLDQHTEKLKEKQIPFCRMFDEKRLGEFWYAKKRKEK